MTETSASLYSFAADYTSASIHASYPSSSRPLSSSSTAVDDPQNDSSSGREPSNEALLEKKRKNASAQAAFRARRSTYIANLEETVTSLETVVRKLQDACRDAHDDISELREENVRLKALVVGFEERERIWKAYAKATAGTPAAVAATSQLSVTAPPTHHGTVETPLSSAGSLHDQSASGTCYGEEGTVYGDDAYNFGKVEDCDVEHMRNNGYLQQQNPALRLYTSGPSSTITASPTPLSSVPLAAIPTTPNTAPIDCNFNGLPSMTMYTTNGTGAQDGSNYCVDANMPPSNYSAQCALPSAYTISLDYSAPPSHRRTLSQTSPTDDANGERGQDGSVDFGAVDANGQPKDQGRSRTRRHSYSAFPAPLPPAPRSSTRNSKGSRGATDSAMSNTLAVIKAQAFGNVRKTRARAKKNPQSGEAARAAIEILEARGLGLGLDISGGVKRRKRGDLPPPSRP
ncbi:hypothetical protein FRB99_000547 [Tulasnella sp. 403]|nr:hypothetical protein FRB99_000547 [Tulasnella sp. 403]